MRFAFVGLVVLLLLVGALIYSQRYDREVASSPEAGIGGAPPADNETNIDLNLSERARLHTLLQEHAAVGAIHLQRLYDGENTVETSERLLENSEQLSNYFRDNPGFRNIWSMHLQEYENYTLAVKNDDGQGAQIARQNLMNHADEFGEVVNTMFPQVSAGNAANAMRDHADLTLSIVDAHAEDDDSEKAIQMAKSSAQAAKFAETLVP